MVFLCSVVLGFITKPLTMIRLFAELFGHYRVSPNKGGTGHKKAGGITRSRRLCVNTSGYAP
jgi:hypothetical protein